MKQFLAVFMGSPSGKAHAAWEALSDSARQERIEAGKAAWGAWVGRNQKSIVFMGSPLGKTKNVDRLGISDIKNLMAAYVVMQGESHEQVAQLFLEHPHFMIFPGDSVEIMECLPIPQ